MSRTVKTADERQLEIIAAAQQLFYSKGYESTSVSDIVRAVGVAQGTFYYHFDSKTAVLEAMIKHLAAQAQVVLHSIVDDPAIPAIPKWRQAFQVTGNWKLARRDELIEIMRLYRHDDNVLMAQKLKTELAPMIINAYAKIIRQGVDEGVFDTPMIAEAAEVCLAITTAFSEGLADLLLYGDENEDPVSVAQRRMAATQTAVERVLGAPEGSLTLLEPDSLAAWFE